MAIITISRGSYSKGKEVAEKVAGETGLPVHFPGRSSGRLQGIQYP
jgi:hypothetical protein